MVHSQTLPPAIEIHVKIISDLIAIAETDPERLVRAVNINGGGHKNTRTAMQAVEHLAMS